MLAPRYPCRRKTSVAAARIARRLRGVRPSPSTATGRSGGQNAIRCRCSTAALLCRFSEIILDSPVLGWVLYGLVPTDHVRSENDEHSEVSRRHHDRPRRV